MPTMRLRQWALEGGHWADGGGGGNHGGGDGGGNGGGGDGGGDVGNDHGYPLGCSSAFRFLRFLKRHSRQTD